MMRGGRAEAPVPRSDISLRLDQKTDNFKMAIVSRFGQWSPSVLTEEKKKNQLAQTEVRFINTIIIIIIRGGNYLRSLAFTSACDSTKRRQISRWPWQAELCSGVH